MYMYSSQSVGINYYHTCAPFSDLVLDLRICSCIPRNHHKPATHTDTSTSTKLPFPYRSGC